MRQFENYKESGVEWIGKIPSDWNNVRLKYLAFLNPSKSELAELPGKTEVTFLPMENVSENGVINVTESRQLDDISGGYTYCRNDDVIVAKITPCFENGKGALCSGLMNQVAFGSTEFIVLRVDARTSPRYLYYLTKTNAFRKLGEGAMTGSAGQKRIPENFVSNFRSPFPHIKEQEQISEFLDIETTRIDQLITNKRQQIKKLNELRQITISRAVTQGLDPDVPMRDSGIEWLGKSPKHWELTRLKTYIKFMEQGWSPQCEARTRNENEWGVLKVGCVNGYQFNSKEHKALPSELVPRLEYEIKKGDILISRSNTRLLLGNACLVDSNYPRLLLCDKLYRIYLNQQRLLSEYLVLFLGAIPARYHMESEATGTSQSMQNIGQDTIKGLQITVPSIAEQKEIIKFINNETTKIDWLNENLNKQIKQLEELRKITIHNAVTGKIKVTG